MKYKVGIAGSIIAGIFIGLFGVIVSVFADGGTVERLLTIAIILGIYFMISGLLAYFLPNYGWKWGLFFGVPGIVLLGVYTVLAFNIYYTLYMVLIGSFACLGAQTGNKLATRWKKK